MFPGFEEMLQQAQQMTQQLSKVKQELANQSISKTVGGGMVTAWANGVGQLLKIEIEPQVIDPNDPEMLQDLVVAAVNEVLQAVKQLKTQHLSRLTGGMQIPGLEDLFGGLD